MSAERQEAINVIAKALVGPHNEWAFDVADDITEYEAPYYAAAIFAALLENGYICHDLAAGQVCGRCGTVKVRG